MLSTLKGWVTRLPPLAPHSPMNRPGEVKVPSTGIQLSPAEALARKVAEECKRADHALKDAFRFHDSRLFPEKKEANRPRRVDEAATQLVNQLAPTYFEERDGDVKTWASDHASTFFAQWKPRAHRPGVPGGVSAAAGSASAAADASNTDATAKKKHLKLWSHTVTRRIIQACMHVFSADGSHMSFRTPKTS